MDSGRPVICFPNGIYRITTPINIPPTVQRIEGSFSTVYLDFRTAGNDDNKINQELAESGFVIGARELPLFLRRVVVRNDINVTSNKAKIAFLYSGAGAFVLADDVVGEMVAIKRLSSGGEIWGENVIGGKFSFEGRKGVWFRQLNTEGKGVRILNEGARLWVLGTKTENNMTLLQNSGGAISEMFGGLAYMVHSDGKKVPYLRNLAGRITAAFAEEAFFPDAIYETILESDNAGKILRIQGNSMPERHHSAHIVPQVSTDSAAAVQ
jgi:hypothetical protein